MGIEVPSSWLPTGSMLVLMTGVACGAALVAPTSSKLEERVTLKIGQSALIEGEALRVEFVEVLEDSRCPVGVTCVWEGDAIARFIVEKNKERAELDLHTHPTLTGEGTHAGYIVRLVELAPVPQSDRPIQPEDYVATIVVTKA